MILAVLSLLVISVTLTGLVIHVAGARGWAGDDAPGVQRFHRHWVSRLGGVAVFCALAIWLALGPVRLAPADVALWVACLLPAFAAGLAEDCTSRVGPGWRLALTLGGAAVAWSMLEVQVVRFGIGPVDDVLRHAPLLSLALSVLFVGGTAHAVNLIDGYNGLAGSYGVMVLLATALVAHWVGDPTLAGIALGAAAATAGFLFWNFPRGRIFLGDGGAYLLGTVIAFLLVRLVRDHPAVAPMFAALLLVYPAFETLFSIWRKRVLRGGSPLEPDGVHLHMLLHKRLARTMRRGASLGEQVLRNAATTLYAGPLLVGTVLPALALWRHDAALAACFGLFVAGYVALYRALVRFRMPAALRLSAAWAAKQAASAPAESSTQYPVAIRARAFVPSRARSAASRRTRSIASPRAALSPAGTSTPAPPPSSSGVPPTAVARTGRP